MVLQELKNNWYDKRQELHEVEVELRKLEKLLIEEWAKDLNFKVGDVVALEAKKRPKEIQEFFLRFSPIIGKQVLSANCWALKKRWY